MAASTVESGLFGTADDMTDVTFIVEDKKLYFYKMVLTLSSPVFKAMFTDDFKEKSAREIPLPGKKYADVVAFFKQIHPVHSAEPITDGTLQQILPLADEYQVDSIRKKCEQYIGHKIDRKQALSDDELLFYLGVCEEYRLTSHRETLVTIGAKRRVLDLEKSPKFKFVPPSATSDMLRRRCVRLENSLYGREGVRSLLQSFCIMSAQNNIDDQCCYCLNTQTVCIMCFKHKVNTPAKTALDTMP